MTDKERLETIKELVKNIESILYDEWRQQELTNLIESLYYDDHVDWLLNRIEELEEERDDWTAFFYYMTNQVLMEQNQRYKQFIEHFAYCDEDYEGMLRLQNKAKKLIEGENRD